MCGHRPQCPIPLPLRAWLQETAVSVIPVFDLESIYKNRKEPLEKCVFMSGNLKRRKYSSEIRSVIAIVKQADVPAAAQCIEELQQRPRPFGKLEPAKTFTFNGSR